MKAASETEVKITTESKLIFTTIGIQKLLG